MQRIYTDYQLPFCEKIGIITSNKFYQTAAVLLQKTLAVICIKNTNQLEGGLLNAVPWYLL
jgi:hypothetical protein